VHRIGRTGRAGKKGTAYTFFTEEDGQSAGKLVLILRKAGQAVPGGLSKIAQEYSRKGDSGGAHKIGKIKVKGKIRTKHKGKEQGTSGKGSW
jgi:superfamily II DNA/RNA helicase